MKNKNVCLILSEMAEALRTERSKISAVRAVNKVLESELETNKRLRAVNMSLKDVNKSLRDDIATARNNLNAAKIEFLDVSGERNELEGLLEDLQCEIQKLAEYASFLEKFSLKQFGTEFEVVFKKRRADLGLEVK